MGETGRVDVELTLRTQPRRLTPSSRCEFNGIYLFGAEAGQSLTLSSKCRMRSIFSLSPSVGSELGFEDMTQFDITQADVLEAVMQMFNLRIWSDERSRKVYVEPFDEFYSSAEVDWSDKVLLSEPMLESLLASQVHQLRQLGYLSQAGGAVERFNNENQTMLGRWTRTTDSRLAKQGVGREVNQLFSPSLSVAGVVASAPSALLLAVGDRDDEQLGEQVVRIVRYEGLQPLPEGESWGFPSYGREYPLAAFHYPGEFTLCFEDRDSAEGLHRYYDSEWRRDELRQSVSVGLYLWPDQVASLADYGGPNPSLGSTFILVIDGQRAKYHLAQVESYDVGRRVARCRFVRRLGD